MLEIISHISLVELVTNISFDVCIEAMNVDSNFALSLKILKFYLMKNTNMTRRSIFFAPSLKFSLTLTSKGSTSYFFSFSLTKEERWAAQNEDSSCLLTLHCAASSATGSPADEKYSHVSSLAASPPMSILCFRNFILLLVLPYRPSPYRTECAKTN